MPGGGAKSWRRPCRSTASRRCRPADDSLVLLFLCCDESLSPTLSIPLTLRAVAGLTTREIAAAYLVPEATMAQRISRAKAKLRGRRFELPANPSLRLRSVCEVLYLLFNEGYTSSSGPDLARVDLSSEAIRLARLLHAQASDEPEVAGLLALMLLTDARRAGPDSRGRRAGAARRAGSLAVGSRADRRGPAAAQRHAGHGPHRRVPVAGRHRRPARRGPVVRHDPLAGDCGRLREVGGADRQPDGAAQPGRRGLDGRGTRGGTRAAGRS